MENEFMLKLIAELNKQLSKKAINNDLKSLDNTMYVKILAKLSKTIATKELKKQLKELNDLYVKVGANVQIDKNTKKQLEKSIQNLQHSISDLEIGLKASKEHQVKLGSQVKSIRNKIQQDIENNPISFNLEIDKDNLLTGAKRKNLINRSKDLFSAVTVVGVIVSQLKESVSTFLELDTAMTNLWKVSDEITSREQFTGLLTKWNKLAQELKVSTESLINSTSEWSKIGFDLDTSEELAKITTIFEKTAEITNEKANATLVSVAQAFTEIDGYGAEEYVQRVEAIGNKINAIGNKYAISSEGIADALQNSSAALVMANNDLDEAIAMIATGNKIFQSAEEMGSALKIVSARLRGQKGELEALGEDTEGMIEGVSKVQTQILNLTGNKVNIFESDKETLKSTYEILLEIGKVYNSLSNKDQASLVEIMFGKDRMSAGASLLLNYGELEKVKNDSINAVNSMAEEYDKYMQSAEASIVSFKEKLIETYSVFMSGNLIKFAADTGSAILDLINHTDLLRHSLLAIATINIGKGITTIGATIASTAKQMNIFGSALEQVKNLPLDKTLREDVLKQVGIETKNLTEKNLKLLLSQKQLVENDRILILENHNISKSEAKATLEKMKLTSATNQQSNANIRETTTTFTLKRAMTSLKTSIIGVGTAIKTAFLSNPIGWVLTGITTAVSIASTVMSNYNQKLEETKQATKEAADKANTLGDEIAELTNKYISLSETVKTNSDAKEDLITTQTELIKKLGLESESIENLISKYGSLDNAIKQVSIDSLKKSQIDLVAGLKIAKEELLDVGADGFWGTNNVINAVGKDAVKAFKELEKVGLIGSGSYGSGGGALVLTGDDKTVEGILENYQKLEDALKTLRDSNAFTTEELSNNSLYQAIYAKYNEMKDAIESYNTSIGDLNENLAQQIMLASLQGQEIPQTEEAFEIFKQELIDIAIASKKFIGTEEEIANVINNYLATVPQFQGFYSIPLENELNAVEDLLNKTSNKLTDPQIEAFEAYKKNLDTISNALSDINNLESGDIASLMTEFAQYGEVFKQFGVNGTKGTGDLQGALKEVSRQMKETAKKNIPELIGAIEDMFQTIRNPKGNLSQVRKEFEELKKVYEDINESRTFDLDYTTDLINRYPELAEAVKIVGEEYGFEKEALIDLINARAENINTIASYEIQATKDILKNVQARITAYETEYMSIQASRKMLAGHTKDELFRESKEVDLYDPSTGYLDDPSYQFWLKQKETLEAKLVELEDYLKDGYNFEKFNTKDSSKEKETKETFDWYETYIDRTNEKLSELESKVDDTYSTWKKRNEDLKAQLKELEESKEILEEFVVPGYENKMASVGLNSKYVKLIKEGLWNSSNHTLGIQTITDETLIEKIEEYIKWYGKWQAASEELLQTNQELKESESKKFDFILAEYDAELSLIESKKAQINNLISKMEEQNYTVSKVLYQGLARIEAGQLEEAKQQKQSLVDALNASMKNGTILDNSEEWYEAMKEINDVTIAIQEGEIALEQYNNAMLDLEWSNFDKMLESIHDIVEETDFLMELLSDSKMFTEKGEFTNEGLATLGQYGVQYQTHMEKAKDYAYELIDIQEQLAKDPQNNKLLEREEELLQLQRDSILAAEDSKQAMIELAQEGIQAQIDYTQELIDKKKELLEEERALYEYQKSIAEKTEAIADLKKMESVYKLDNSEEGKQKLQSVQDKLAEAEKELEEMQYDKWHQDQTDMLDALMNEYTELQNKLAENTEALFSDMVNTVNKNADIIHDTLVQETTRAGIKLSTEMTSIWGKYKQDSSEFQGVVKEYGEQNHLDFTTIDATLDGIKKIFDESTLDTSITDISTTLFGILEALTKETGLKIDLSDFPILEDDSEDTEDNSEIEISDNTTTTDVPNTPTTTPVATTPTENTTEKQEKPTAQVGQKIKSVSGKWYETSLGGDSGNVNKYSPDYFLIDRISGGAEYPYHIQAYINGKASGGSGWVKGVQLGYKHGKKRIAKEELAWTQEGYGENEIIYRATDHALLTRLNPNDVVFSNEQTQRLWEWSRNGNMKEMFSAVPPISNYTPNICSQVRNNGGDVNVTIDNITLPNVQNPSQFASQLIDVMKHNQTVQKAVRAVSTDLLVGKPSLGVHRFK